MLNLDFNDIQEKILKNYINGNIRRRTYCKNFK